MLDTFMLTLDVSPEWSLKFFSILGGLVWFFEFDDILDH